MKSFIEAYNYLRNTSAKEIATRTVIYGAFFNSYLYKNFGHDYLLDIVAALHGEFNYDIVKDAEIMDMLQEISFGYDSNWRSRLSMWGQQHAGNENELNAFNSMLMLLTQGKGDSINDEFNYIMTVMKPDSRMYFPEMYPGSEFDYYLKNWPRI